ncbi:MAG: calcineurin-like phosphoesterase family protein [Gemmatimonadota bacterium]|nr:calcineurin-like phosphoesterase family protein [Gemmatimonadota bacterium]
MATIDRRSFLQASGAAALATALPDRLVRDPYVPFGGSMPVDVVRVRGRVTGGRRGLGDVAVSDGVSVVRTAPDGTFELLADATQPFVWVTTPAGHATPTSSTGTAAFYRPLTRDRRGEMRLEFALTALEVPDERHGFLVLADPQTQNMFEIGRLHAETVPDVQATARAMGGVPLFGIACGDIMYDDLTLYPEYERAVAEMHLPFYQVVGNHDLVYTARTDEEANTTFSHHFGPAYYSFDRGEVHYVVLDDVFWYGNAYIGYLDGRQLGWLRADLAGIEPGRTVVVLLHIPALSTGEQRNGGTAPGRSSSVMNREALYRLLEPYQATVISGHTHEHERHREGDVRHHVTGAVCGAWWSGDICWDGTPNGYGVYDVRGSELRWRYKATGQPVEHQIRLYARGSDPGFSDAVIANVWDADETWTVVWYEDGERRGAMTRRLGMDPRSVIEQTGPDKPPRRGWVEPTRTDHLYYAPVAPGADVLVEATDPWGRTYVGRAVSPPTGGGEQR